MQNGSPSLYRLPPSLSTLILSLYIYNYIPNSPVLGVFRFEKTRLVFVCMRCKTYRKHDSQMAAVAMLVTTAKQLREQIPETNQEKQYTT